MLPKEGGWKYGEWGVVQTWRADALPQDSLPPSAPARWTPGWPHLLIFKEKNEADRWASSSSSHAGCLPNELCLALCWL